VFARFAQQQHRRNQNRGGVAAAHVLAIFERVDLLERDAQFGLPATEYQRLGASQIQARAGFGGNSGQRPAHELRLDTRLGGSEAEAADQQQADSYHGLYQQ